MGAKILTSADNVWKYYTEHTKELARTTKLVACNEEFDIEIHITDESGVMNATVYLGNVEVATEDVIDYADCRETMKGMYQKYIYDAENFVKSRQQEAEYEDEEELIEDRENEMDDAVYDLLSTFCGGSFIDAASKETQEIIEDIKDTLCEMLFEKHGIEVYRPMYIADDDGNEEFSLYPYAELAG